MFVCLLLCITAAALECDHQLAECSFIRWEKVNKSSLYLAEPDPTKFGNPNTTESFWTHKNWLTSRFHFSFGDYYDQNRTSFGVLRVLNDDILQPQRGFGKHPHNHMEIISYVVSGELTHKDTEGNKGNIYQNDLQIISAGSGIEHQEANPRTKLPCRFIQSWVLPRSVDSLPRYTSVKDYNQPNNTFVHLIGDKLINGTQLASIDQDFNLYSGKFTGEMIFDVRKKRQVYILCVLGPTQVQVSLEQADKLKTHEALKVWGPASIYLYPPKGYAQVLIYEMKLSK